MGHVACKVPSLQRHHSATGLTPLPLEAHVRRQPEVRHGDPLGGCREERMRLGGNASGAPGARSLESALWRSGGPAEVGAVSRGLHPCRSWGWERPPRRPRKPGRAGGLRESPGLCACPLCTLDCWKLENNLNVGAAVERRLQPGP